MKQIKQISFFLLYIILTVCLFSCSDKPEIEPEPPEVKISADKTSIKANNRDETIFTVTVDGEEMTSSVIITQTGKITPVEEMHFLTDSAATYTFYATWHDIKSNEINIEAIDIDILLTIDKLSIKANNKDTVTFSVKADEEDVTSLATIIQTEVSDSTLTESEFHTKTSGTYTFYALYNGKKSNEVRVDVSEVIVSLSVDKTSIKANNWDKAIFTVMADDDDVTTSAVIMQQRYRDNMMLEYPEFLTDEAASYSFFAIYDEVLSNEINVEATYVELNFLKGYSVAEITSTSCEKCPRMTDALVTLQQSQPDRIHVIALHPYGKYCYSELAGSLSQTAIDFADRVNNPDPPPPMAIIDLDYPVILYTTTTATQSRLTGAINLSMAARGKISLTGMSVLSNVSDMDINFVVRFKTKKTDTYRFFAFIVEDGVVHRQSTGDYISDREYVHNNVATYQLNGDPFLGVDLGTIEEDKEETRFFSIHTDNFNTGRNVNLDNCRIVCYTLRMINGTKYIVDNVTSCPVNGSVRYLYER